MGFWRGLRWGLFLGVIAALVGRVMSGDDNKENWEQAKVADMRSSSALDVAASDRFIEGSLFQPHSALGGRREYSCCDAGRDFGTSGIGGPEQHREKRPVVADPMVR